MATPPPRSTEPINSRQLVAKVREMKDQADPRGHPGYQIGWDGRLVVIKCGACGAMAQYDPREGWSGGPLLDYDCLAKLLAEPAAIQIARSLPPWRH